VGLREIHEVINQDKNDHFVKKFYPQLIPCLIRTHFTQEVDVGDLADEKDCELKDRIAYEAAATCCKRKTSQTVNDR
jgi:hypothetical protein